MMKKRQGSLLAVILVMFLANLLVVLAASDTNDTGPHLFASLSNPRMVLYGNLTSKTLEVPNSVIINNKNDFPVTINVEPSKSLKQYVTLDETNFTLQPDERREVNYTLKVDSAGEYNGEILVSFQGGENENKLSIAQKVVLHVTDDRLVSSKMIIIAIGLIVAVVLVIIFIVFANKIKNNPKQRRR